MTTHRYVNCLWDDAMAALLDPVGRLVYRSNLLGSDQRITNTGGGSMSSKIPADPNIVWVTDPSMTADVEGVYGPGMQVALATD